MCKHNRYNLNVLLIPDVEDEEEVDDEEDEVGLEYLTKEGLDVRVI